MHGRTVSTSRANTHLSAQSWATADASLRVVKGLKGASRIEHRKPRDPVQRVPGTSRRSAAVVGDGQGSIGENLLPGVVAGGDTRLAVGVQVPGTQTMGQSVLRARCCD